eukprot:TRINITY_DN7289_c0_g1_i5.p1 TRINITY_DN7289_c0_g1~~TRINITY_DN7289_c0_g1_i5.p1  ORF type:complete len:787 (+),score=224.21 TRINITY_DN7289_c0_g1_i5:74-2434(+)
MQSPLPKCKHGENSVRRQVKKDGPNKGRFFFACRRFPPDNCSFFQWDSSSITTATTSSKSSSALSSTSKTLKSRKGGKISAEKDISSKSSLDVGGKKTPWWKSQPKGTVPGLSGPKGTRDGVSEKAKQDRVVFSVKNSQEIVVRVPKAHEFICKHSDLPSGLTWMSFEGENTNATTRKRKQESSTSYIIPRSFYDEVLRVVQELNVPVSDIPSNVFSFVKRWEEERDSEDENIRSAWAVMTEELPPPFIDVLFPFQKEGIVEGIRRKGRILLADDPGLGKTIQALGIAWVFRKSWPLLIICPSSVRFVWKDEIERWFTDSPETKSVQVILSGKDSISGNIVILSYDLCATHQQSLKRFRCVIADEAHALKSHDAKRTKVIAPILLRAKHSILLTGTPSLNRPIELFTQVHCLIPSLFPSRMKFGFRYCNAKMGPFGWDMQGSSNLTELNWLLEESIMVRRKKDAVLLTLPPKKRYHHSVELTDEGKRNLEENMAEMSDLEKKISRISDPIEKERVKFDYKRCITDRYRLSGVAKLEGAKRFLHDFMSNNEEKVIVFAHHQAVLDGIEDAAKEWNMEYVRIDGSTSPKKRPEYCAQFRTVPSCRLAILSITAAGVGITLTPCSRVVFAELYWTPGIIVQAEDRAHRLSQKEDVEVHFLIGKGTLDTHIWPLLQRKLRVVGHALEGKSRGNDLVVEPSLQLDKFIEKQKHHDTKSSSSSLIEHYFKKVPKEASEFLETEEDLDEVWEVEVDGDGDLDECDSKRSRDDDDDMTKQDAMREESAAKRKKS